MSSRIKRVETLIKQEISKIIQTKLNDERIGFISIVDVKVSKDLSSAKVFYSQIGSEEEHEASFKGLCSSAKYIKGELGHVLHLKRIPDLRFIYDDSLERGSKLQALFKKDEESS